jgi:hypothetical protein
MWGLILFLICGAVAITLLLAFFDEPATQEQ